MIQFLADNIDQLDLALDQLAMNDRNFDRFALLLIDNVVELTIHQFSQDKASENTLWRVLKNFPNDPSTVEDALSQYFDRKAKAACKLGLFNDSLKESILTLHQFRNTAYHKGLRHEGILHSLALFYFECCCAVLQCYELRWWGWGNNKISHRARKYLGDIGPGDPRKQLNGAYVRLSEVAASMGGSLISDLVTDLNKTIDEVDRQIEFLATDNSRVSNRDEVIIDVQAWPFSFSDEARKFAKDRGYTVKQEWPVDCEWIKKTYKWPVCSDPINGWRARVKSIDNEKDRHVALGKYCNFLAQTETIRSQIEKAAEQLDAHIQQLIDESRGK